MRVSTTTVVLISLGGAVHAQAPADTAAVLDSIAREVQRVGARHGQSIWPGHRPDTIPLAFVLPAHGTFLFHWRGDLPNGYLAVAGLPDVAWREERALGAASTGTRSAASERGRTQRWSGATRSSTRKTRLRSPSRDASWLPRSPLRPRRESASWPGNSSRSGEPDINGSPKNSGSSTE